MSKVIGKKELLKWVADVSGQPCTKLEDLRDGVAFIKIFAKIWPKIVNLKTLKWKNIPKSDAEINANWDAIRFAMQEIKLPLDVLDKKAIMGGKFKQSYTFLVMLFFLQNLSENHDFSVDFAHPIDGKLASFLQSTASVECLARGGALKLEDIPNASFTKDWIEDQSEIFSATSSYISIPNSTSHLPSRTLSAVDTSSTLPSEGLVEQTENFTTDELDINSPKVGHVSDIDPIGSPAAWNKSTGSTIELSVSERNSISSIDASSALNWEEEFYAKLEDTAKQSHGVQTLLSSRKIEKLMIRSMKGKKEVDELKRMLEEAYEKINELQKNNSAEPKQTIDVPDKDESPSSTISDVIWKNKQNKIKGELLLTKMRYEIESLNRQLLYIKQDKDFVEKKFEQQIAELKASHENELSYQKDLIRGDVSSQQFVLLNDKLKTQLDYQLEMKKLQDEIEFEVDRIRQGGLHAEDDDAIEDELLRLRQLRVLNSKQIKNLEENNISLQNIVEKMNEQIAQEHDKVKQLHQHYREQEKALFGDINVTDLESRTEDSTKREKSLLVAVRKLETDIKMLNTKYKSESEHLKYELFKLQQKPVSKLTSIDPMESEFDKEQKIERLEAEVSRLKRANNFLRERSAVFDQMNTERGQSGYNDETEEDSNNISEAIDKGAIWSPSPYIGTPEESEETNGKILFTINRLEATDKQVLQHLFWKIIAEQSILQQRIIKAKSFIEVLGAKYSQLLSSTSNSKVEFEQSLAAVKSAHSIEVEELKHAFTKEVALIQVKLQLAEENLSEVKEQNAEGKHSVMKIMMEEDEKRFWYLFTKLKATKDEIAAYRLREKLWTHLIECQRRNIELTEQMATAQSYEEAVALNKQREQLDVEATSYVQQLQSLTQQHLPKTKLEGSADEDIDMIIKDAIKASQEQINLLTKKTEELLKLREREVEKIRGYEFQIKELQLDIEKEKSITKSHINQYNRMLKEKTELANEVNVVQVRCNEEIAKLKTRVIDLTYHMQEMQNVAAPYPNLRNFSKDQDEVSDVTTVHNAFDLEIAETVDGLSTIDVKEHSNY